MVRKETRDEKARHSASEKNAIRLAKFSAVSESEGKVVNQNTKRILNEKRQNYVQALFDYASVAFRVRQMSAAYDRLQAQIGSASVISIDSAKDGKKQISLLKDTKDEYGFPLSYDEMVVIMQARFADIKLTMANAERKKADIMKTWEITNEQIEKQINDWILGKQKIY